MSTLLQFQCHLATSSPNTKSCSLLTPKNQYLFVANQRLHSSNINLKIHANCVLGRAKGDSEDESHDESPAPPKGPLSPDDSPVPLEGPPSPEDAPAPPKRFPFEWKKWAVGILFFFILPSYRLKMGPFGILKDKVDEMLETAETAAEVVEDLAELVERLADEAEKKLPDGTKLNDLAEAIENLAGRVDEKAEQAQELIKEVQNIAEDIEEMMEAKLLDATRQDKKTEDQGTRIHRQPDDANLNEGAQSIKGLTEQAEKKAEETQELIQQVDKLGRDIKELDSSSPAATSRSQETGHDDKSVKRLTKV